MKNKVKVKICGMPYTIKIVPEDDRNLIVNDRACAGVVHYRPMEIYLSNDNCSEMLKRVLTHELTHVYVYASGMNQLEWTEENVADFVEAHMQDIYDTRNKIMKLLEE